jgi:hypothetical protein
VSDHRAFERTAARQLCGMKFNETGVGHGKFFQRRAASAALERAKRQFSSVRLRIVTRWNCWPAHPKQEAIRMARQLVTHNKPVFDQFHPRVYGTAVGLVIWFALAAWILFDRQSDISLPLGMVSVLLLVAVLLPWSLSLVWKRHRLPSDRHVDKVSFNDWKAGDFAVWGSRIRSIHAAIDMLLPLAAVAFGLTGIGIVFLVCAYNAP